MAAGPAPPLLPPPPPPPPPAGEADAGLPLSPAAAARRDPRVRCCSRRGLSEVLALCAPFVRALAQGQPGGPAAAGEALWNFETAVRENVTIDGQPWEETSEDSELQSGSSIKILEDQFDELVVETTTKRKQWPKKILMHAVQTMKAEQEMLKLYQPVVTPEERRPQPSQALNTEEYNAVHVKLNCRQISFDCVSVFLYNWNNPDAYITDLKQMTEMASKQISGAMKSLPTLIERAEGFSQVLNWQPTLELCKLRQEVFVGCNVKQENNAQKFVSPGEVTPTNADTSKNCVLLKRKKAIDSSERRRYPLRRRKISLSA